MPARSRAALTALTAALALALGACGDDEQTSGGGGGGGDRLTQAEFVRQARDLCRRSSEVTRQEALKLVGDPSVSGGTSEESQVAVLEKLGPIVQREFGKLKALRPPADIEPGFRDFTRRIDQAFGLLDDLGRATRAKDRGRLSEITTQFTEIAGPTRRFAQRYGLRECLPENTP